MITEDELLQSSARLLLDEHGISAEDHALKKMQQCMEIEDVVQASLWLAIAQTINHLQSKIPSVVH